MLSDLVMPLALVGPEGPVTALETAPVGFHALYLIPNYISNFYVIIGLCTTKDSFYSLFIL